MPRGLPMKHMCLELKSGSEMCSQDLQTSLGITLRMNRL